MNAALGTRSIRQDQVRIKDAFWSRLTKLMAEKVIPYQWNALNDNIPNAEPSHSVENFRIAAGLSDGTFYGERFQDSDVAKWLEAASYSLIEHPNPELEAMIDGLIELIGEAQQADGYLNTFFIVARPEQRWSDFSHGHELYCAGHLIEAAVAYYEATGKTKLLRIVCKFADYIDSVMGPEPHKRQVYCGHEEIELALVKLFRVTGQERYLKLCQYFIEQRGIQPCYLEQEETFGFIFKDKWFGLDYHQAHMPVTEQHDADGHAVRAMYLYTAMADLVLETGDLNLKRALDKLWESATNRRMYITGAFGSLAHGERFTVDYDLPNDVAYAETCASIGAVFWAHRMLQIERNGKYGDLIERALYNGILSGMSLDGTKYFYVNPLEVVPEAVSARSDHRHVKTERVPWFGCSCCPPNIARLISSIGQYVYTQDSTGIQIHQYIGSQASFQIGGKVIKLKLQAEYPNEGTVGVEVEAGEAASFALSFRVPGWCRHWSVRMNGRELSVDFVDGYALIERLWEPGDRLDIEFELTVQRIRSHPKIRHNVGQVALQRGPVIYCLEEIDNGGCLASLSIPRTSELRTVWDPSLGGGFFAIEGEARRVRDTGEGNLYAIEETEQDKVSFRAVPYRLWGNRRPGEMRVWIREEG